MNKRMPDEKQLKELLKSIIQYNNALSGCLGQNLPKKLKVKKLYEDSQVPTKANDRDGGYDLHCHSIKVYNEDGSSRNVDSVHVVSDDTIMINTGISMAIPDGYVGLIFDRSSMGVEGFSRLAGVIDSCYRGELKVILNKRKGYKQFVFVEDEIGIGEHMLSESSDIPTRVAKDERIAQLVIVPVAQLELEVVEDLEETERGDKGFGSSGK